MRFRIIPVLFLFAANFLLLAHTIVPHHHHNGLANFVTSHIANEKSGNDNSNDQPDDKDDDTHCILREAVVIPSNTTRILPDQRLKINILENFNLNQPVVLLFLSDCIPDHCTLFDYLHNRDISSLYLFQLNNSRGLRAPPRS